MVKKKVMQEVNQEDRQRTSRETSRRLRKGIGSETRCWTGGQEERKKSRENRKTRGHVVEKQSGGLQVGAGARTCRRTERITNGGKAGGQAEAPSSKSISSKTRRRKARGDSE